jgi:ribose-phosphate pyrophosphokinase
MNDDLRLFTLERGRSFGEGVARALGVDLAEHEEREFEDGEHKTRPLVNVRGRDVYVVHSLYGEPGASVNDKLCRLLFFLGALRDAAAARVTAVVPYLCYGRKDRRTKSRDPVTTRYVARLFEAMAVDRVVSMDVHNPAAFDNAFRCGTERLEAAPLVLRWAAEHLEPPVAVVSPDAGGVKRAEALREALERRIGAPVEGGIMEKRRSGGVVSGRRLSGEMDGRSVLVVDDLIATGTTLARAAAACREAGAREVRAVATHGLFHEGAEEMLRGAALDRVVVTNTIPPFRVPEALVREKVEVLDVRPHFAEVIRRMHTGGSLVELGEE